MPSSNGGLPCSQMLLGAASTYSRHLAQKAQLPVASIEGKATAVVSAHKHTLLKHEQVSSY